MIVHRVESADGLGLHVVESGPSSGTPVVLAHGWPDTHEVWRHQVEALSTQGYRVVTYDQRGFGRSDRPADVAGSHVFKAMVDIGSILDSLEIDGAHLVGHDWGSAPCWLAATFAAERVLSLTSLSVGHPSAFRHAGLEQKQKSFYMLLFQFVDIAEEWLSANDWANMQALIGDPDNWPRRRRELERPGALTASLNWYRANMSPETLVEPPRDLPKVAVPTLGVIGSDDWALLETQMVNSAEYVEEEFRHVSVPGAAHWLQTDRPGYLNDLLTEWLAGHA